MKLKLSQIKEIYKSEGEIGGYTIEFLDGKKIHITKRRTIIALLILIHKGEGSEADIAQGNSTIPEIRKALEGKIPRNYIKDYYGDANKPYSELWNEEGFTFIDNLKGGRAGRSQKYTLKESDHQKLFKTSNKANRKAPNAEQKVVIRDKQNGRCNLCGSKLVVKGELKRDTYAKDRRREVFDHRKPVERGGNSDLENYQALCFYCNKCKWQICNICSIADCDESCALRNPEKSQIVAPSSENVSDVLGNRNLFND